MVGRSHLTHWLRSKGEWAAVGAILAAAATVLWPLLQNGYPAGRDALAHLFRLYLLEGALREGIWLPRWSADLLFGYGYALFNFYSPLFYYLAAIPRLLGLGYLEAMTAAIVATMALAAGGSFVLGASLWRSRLAGVLSSVAYVSAPYLLSDLYDHTALAELLGLAVLPWLFWALSGARSGSPTFLLATALATAALVLSHNPTAILGLSFAVLWAAWLTCEPSTLGLPSRNGSHPNSLPAGEGALKGWLSRALPMVVGLALGMGLSAFFWLPATAEAAATRLDLVGGRENALQLLREGPRLVLGKLLYDYPGIPQFGLVQAALAGGGGLALLAFGSGVARRKALVQVTLLAVALGLNAPLSEPFWAHAPLVGAMSFPWRLVGIGSLPAALLAGGLAAVGSRGPRLAALGLAGGASLAASLATLAPAYLDADNTWINALWLARYEAGSAFPGTTVPTQFMPRDVSLRVEELRNPPPTPVPTSDDSIPTEVEVVAAGPLQWELVTSSPSGARLRLHQHFFPGWQAEADGPGERQGVAVAADGPRGVQVMAPPEGTHRLSVRFGDTPARTLAAWISWGSLGALIIACTAVGLRQRPSGRPMQVPVRAGGGLLLAAWLGLAPHAGSAKLEAAWPAVEALRLDYAEALRLVGWQADWRPLEAHAAVRLNLYWYVLQSALPDYQVELTLYDGSGATLTRTLRRPLFGTSPTGWWERGELVRDSQWLPLPPGLPAGDYLLGVRLVDMATAAVVDPSPGEARFHLTAPSSTPSDVSIASFSSSLGRLQGGIHLLSWGGPGRLRAGEVAPIRLLWAAEREQGQDFAVSVQLLDRQGGLQAQQDSYPPEHLRLTTAWLPGRVVQETYRLLVPRDLPSGAYDLVAKMYNQDDLSSLPVVDREGRSGSVLPLARVKVVGRREALPRPSRPLDARFGDFARLAGLDGATASGPVLARIAPGTDLALALRWEVTGTTKTPYRVFVHLTDPRGSMVAQVDREPLDRRFPTSFWEPGEEIRDPVSLRLPAEVAPGRYRLLIGLYDPETGTRVPVTVAGESSDSLSLGEVEVGF